MRKRFEQQMQLGRLLIEDTPIPTAKRSGAIPALCLALKEIFMEPKWNEQIFKILEKKILSRNNSTGRVGMEIWQIFVLAQVRMCQNLSYDDLHDLANNHRLIRQLMGIETEGGFERINITYQNLIDNVGLLDDDTVRELNNVIVSFGHDKFKKKETEALRLKTDSFVVPSNVHFPTDYNLLWDSARKSLDMVNKLLEKYHIKGWRKIGNWYKKMKNGMRSIGNISRSGGKYKEERLKKTAQKYISTATVLYKKLTESKVSIPQNDIEDMLIILQLESYMQYFAKHIDLVEKRIIKGEVIPHEEKIFSIFETYTEWINKGKMHPNVELGKNVAITTDHYHLIVDYMIMENQKDVQIVPKLIERISLRFPLISSWSFDKGFWSKENKEKLSLQVKQILILSKKGKCNIQQEQEEHQPIYIKYRKKHSAIESNINELEHRGLDRCPDKSYEHFKRYIGLAVCAYNLKKIGQYLLEQQRQLQDQQNHKQVA